MHVRLVTDPTVFGIVLDGPSRIQNGKPWRAVRLATGVRFFPEDNLEPIPTGLERPAELLRLARLADATWLRRALTRLRVTGRLSDMVYSMEATDTAFYAYQFKPVVKMLNSPSDGLLIADEVGLGKTIEAGLIWTELRARYDLRRLLVLCPRTLRDKWKRELSHKFGVDARIVGADELLGLLKDRAAGTRGFAAISWFNALRPPKGWDDESPDEDVQKRPRTQLAQLLNDAADREHLLDMLIVDEAHHVRNPETLQNRLVTLLNAVSAHRAFLSATPIHLQNRDLLSLLRLLDPDTFERPEAFNDIIDANRALIEARDAVLAPKSLPSDVLSLVHMAQAHPMLDGNEQLKTVAAELDHDALEGGVLDAPRRSSIAWRLEQANLLSHVVTRTRRRDVEHLRVVRDVADDPVAMASVEREFYDAVTRMVAEYALGLNANARFLLSSPQRMLTSCAAASAAYWLKHGSISANGDDEDDESEEDQATLEAEYRPIVDRLATLVHRMGILPKLEAQDGKYRHLVEIINELKKTDASAKLIVFASFKSTLAYLDRRLRADERRTVLLHGSVEEDRDVLLARFRDSPDVDVLLSSEVGSEGVDLQFCWAMVNYDLPWNPMRIEQRIGRIDRLGQDKEKVLVHNLVYEGTIDDVIYERLYRRLDLCRQALGGFEAILGDGVRQVTAIAMDPTLTPDQKAEQINRAAIALENQKKHETELESDAAGLIAHGDFILKTINEARDNNRWIKWSDLYRYAEERLGRSFPGVTINAVEPGSDRFELTWTADGRAAFDDFLARRNARNATRLVGDARQPYLRFTTSVVASREFQVENVSHVHPLIRFAAELDTRDKDAVEGAAVAAALTADERPKEVSPGIYAVAIWKWSTGGAAGDRIAYAGCLIDGSAMLDPEQAETLAATIVAAGRKWPLAPNDPVLARAAEQLERILEPTLQAGFDAFLKERRAENDDRARVRLQTLDRHERAQMGKLAELRERYRRRADAGRSRSLVAATEGRIRALQLRCEQRRADIERQAKITESYSEIAALIARVD